MKNSAVDFYFERFGFCPRQVDAPPASDLGLVVVIPCFNEADLTGALQALWNCERPRGAVEVIVVVNSGEGAAPGILTRNEETLQQARDWAGHHQDPRLRFHLLHFPALPPKKAGVGLARKIGMDEALRRFQAVDRMDGVIACFDADCGCDPNYLVELEEYFRIHPASPGCSLYFEHPLEGAEAPAIYEAITLYELHLRYYVEALRSAQFPCAFHTIGSSMAARAGAYLKQGGMNKRQAGEDFYFLHKLIPLGGFGEINRARVIASPRPSDRVPFGTGRAVRDYLEAGALASYPLQAFDDLRLLFSRVEALREADDLVVTLPLSLREFLQQHDVAGQLNMIRGNVASAAAFRKRFFHWFDGFLAMKYIHYARDHHYGNGDILSVSREIHSRRTGVVLDSADARTLLRLFRVWQRQSAFVS